MDESTRNSPQPSPKPNQTWKREPPLTGKPPLLSLTQALESAKADARRTVYLKTLWPRLERLCQPQSGRFWVIGGRPGNYKTQTMWSMALDMAERRQKVLFISLEEESGAMSLSALSRYSGTPRDRIRAAQLAGDLEFLTTQEQEALAAADDKLREFEIRLRLHGAESHGRNIDDVLQSACRARFDAVFVDHLGMLAREGDNELRELARAVDKLRGLTRGEHVADYRPFVCVSSPLNRDSEKDDERIPRMSDLRGSGRIESDADLVMIMQKRSTEEEHEGPDQVDGFVLKNRQGRCPLVMLFDAQGAVCQVTERKPDAPAASSHWSERNDK